MYRLIVIFILLGIIYLVVKRALFPVKGRAENLGGTEEELVRDPVCGCYIPKSQSYALSLKGKKLFFCSQECFRKYQASNALPKN